MSSAAVRLCLRCLRCLALLFAAWASLGCAATVVRSGKPPLDLAPGYDDRWHSAFLWGVFPANGPYDLGKICPEGWSQVTVARDPFTLLAGAVTLFIYSPSRLSIVCAVPGGPALPPFEGYTPNAPLMPPAPVGEY